jgi:hypothetical protein
MPTILQKGEGVFTEEQMAAMGGRGAPGEISIRNVIVDDQRSIDNWATSSTGEKVLIQWAERNKSTLRRIVNG